MADVGRPIKLTPKIHDELIKVIESGNYIETACAYVGINKSTFYDWLKRGAKEKQRLEENPRAKLAKKEKPFVELSNAVEKALAHAEMRDVEIITKASVNDWKASAWRLERKFPEKWGRKESMKADVNHSGQMDITHQLESLSDEELERIAKGYDIDE